MHSLLFLWEISFSDEVMSNQNMISWQIDHDLLIIDAEFDDMSFFLVIQSRHSNTRDEKNEKKRKNEKVKEMKIVKKMMTWLNELNERIEREVEIERNWDEDSRKKSWLEEFIF